MTARTLPSKARDSKQMSLAEALAIIKPQRSDEAVEALTLCCFYLQTDKSMPLDLRKWLDKYLTNERRIVRTSRSSRQGNLAIKLRRTKEQKAATGRGKISTTVSEYAAALGLDESTVKKWRRDKRFYAIEAVRLQLIQEIKQLP